MKAFSIYDIKAEAYLQPFFSPNKAVALRQFGQAANDENTDFHKHAADYTLFEIGEWDEITGILSSTDAKIPLGTAIEFIEEK